MVRPMAKGVTPMANNEQCGSCAHFGEGVPERQLVELRINPAADDAVLGGCDLAANASINLRVSAISSCDQFQAA